MFATIIGGGDRDESDILVRIDSSGCEPIPQPHGMGAGLEGHGKHHGTAFVATLLCKGSEITRIGV
jgi:hypothetical protein